MSKVKNIFWTIYLGFCVVATLSIHAQGGFDNLAYGGAFIVLAMYLLCGYFIHLYLKKNQAQVERW